MSERIPSILERMDCLLKFTKPVEETEEIPILSAAGRVAAGDIRAPFDQPPFARSPLDGYAVRSEDIRQASPEHPAVLKVLTEVDAGHVTDRALREGEAIRIMTGAAIPAGADCVVRQEDTDYGMEEVSVYVPVGHDQNYCLAGSDYHAGDCLIQAGTRLGYIEIGLLASMGMQKVRVYRKVRAGLLTTGDEIVLPGEKLAPGQIYDSNLYTLSARLTSWDVQVLSLGRVGDQPEEAARRIKAHMDEVDLLVTTGGVSVGRKDIMHDVFSLLHVDKLFWKAALKPGSPTLAGLYKGKLLICLSGNPYGAAVNLELLVRPVAAVMSRRNDLAIQRTKAILTNGFPKKNGVDRYVRAFYDHGKVTLTSGSNESGVMGSMAGCNALALLPAGTKNLSEGTEVEVILL